MKSIYLLSGLGADERAFKNLRFEGYNIVYIKWIKPIVGESLENYCRRISKQVKEANPILIGLSFGGIVAVEIAKLIKTSLVILISSIQTRYQMPFSYRLIGKIGLPKLLPASLLVKSNRMVEWYFGVSKADERKLLESILADTDPHFLKWAFVKIPMWKNRTSNQNVYQIHGTNDRIFPIKYQKSVIGIEGGTHLMVINRAHEINMNIRELLKQQVLV